MDADHLMRNSMADKAVPVFVQGTEPLLFSTITDGRVWKITRLEIFKVRVLLLSMFKMNEHICLETYFHALLP